MDSTKKETAQQQMLDEYCIGILASEVSPEYSEEMRKVQAVLVRTTVYSELDTLSKEEVEEALRKQTKLDREWKQSLETAWQETEGQVVMHGETLALVPFHQLSNGKTRSGAEVLGEDSYPYLQVIECPKDIGAEEQMQTKVLEVAGASVTKKDSAGYVLEVKVGEETCSGESFRDTYELASSCFELQEFDGKTRVVTRGVGHGLGLSQFTANEMAKEGKTYQEILQFFFPGTELKEVAEILWEQE
ncbi:MAG: SpoIID/LytB domain-containing protein [Faecalimonas sp.]|nr:SpoIID/LytB domain-containing protein [Faecalimonas sp.]